MEVGGVIRVRKANGALEELNIEKIRKQINFITHNTGVDPIKIESVLKLSIHDEIPTEKIQDSIIYVTKNMVSLDEPNTALVAGRAMMWKIYKNVYKYTGVCCSEWTKLVKFLVDNNYYTVTILDVLDRLEINEDIVNYGTVKNIDFKNPDFNKTICQVHTIVSKFLIHDPNLGEPIEYPFMINLINAAMLADTVGDMYGFGNKRKQKLFLKYYTEYLVDRETTFNDISDKKYVIPISLSTPMFKNMRRPNGNTTSCYIVSIDDSLSSIMKTLNDVSHISKHGGGVGIYLGHIRPSGTKSINIGMSGDITRWLKIIDAIAVAVDQAGTRKAGITVAYDWWQMDVMLFLEQRELSDGRGDIRQKTLNIFPQILVDNYFISAVKENKDVYLFNHVEFKRQTGIDPTVLVDTDLHDVYRLVERLIAENKANFTYEKISARSLWVKILKVWIKTGSLYIVNKDNINMSNYLKNAGYITQCANLCTESFSILKPSTVWTESVDEETGIRYTYNTNGLYHTCNLLSINAVYLIEKTDAEIREICKTALEIGIGSMMFGNTVVNEAYESMRNLRNIGVGILGVADYLAYYKKTLDDEDGVLLVESLLEKISFYLYLESCNLGINLGSYPMYSMANYDRLLGRDPSELKEYSYRVTKNRFDWVALAERIRNYGIYNFYLLAIAPNSTTSLLMNSSNSYLPIYSKIFYDTSKTASIPVVPIFIKERNEYYKTRYSYSPVRIIEYTARLQKFVDAGISMELNINTGTANISEISDKLIEEFLARRLKAVYYARTISIECESCSN